MLICYTNEEMNQTPSCFESMWPLLNQFWNKPNGIGFLTKLVYYDRTCRYQLFLWVFTSTIHYIYKQGILIPRYWKKYIYWMYSWYPGHQFYLNIAILVHITFETMKLYHKWLSICVPTVLGKTCVAAVHGKTPIYKVYRRFIPFENVLTVGLNRQKPLTITCNLNLFKKKNDLFYL